MAPATPAMNASFDVPSLMMLRGIDSVVDNPTAHAAYARSASLQF